MLAKSCIGIIAMVLASTLFAQEPEKPPLDSAQRAAIAEQASPTASPWRPYSSTEIDAFKKACQTIPCRKNVTIRLLKKDGTYYEQKSELLPPMIQGGLVTLYPGDKVRLIPVFEAGKFKEWQPAPEHTDDTTLVISIEFAQMQGKPDMTATISKTSGPAIKLSLGMFVLDGPDRPVKTTSCPLRPGKWSSFEYWPHPIYSLLVGRAEQLADDAPAICD